MLDAYRDLIDDLLGAPTEVRGLIEEQGAGEVSPEVRLLVAEMRDRDVAVLDRVQTMTRRENAYLKELRLDPPDENADLAAVLSELETARGDLVSILINLSLKDWERVAIHETEGEVTLADEIERHVEFDESQRARLRQQLAAS